MNFNRFLNSQTKNIGMAAGILAVSALISRILGIVRDWLLAKTFGAGPELDIYFVAFRIPDLVYNILIAGGIIVAFLPLFSEYFSRDEEDAWKFTSNALNVFLFLIVFLCLFLFIFSTPLIKLIAPGFDPGQLEKTAFLTQIMFLSPIFFGLGTIFSGILQYFNRFLVYSLCPIIYNLGIIFGILVLSPPFGILGVALGVILGAFLYFLIQIPAAMSCGFKYRPIFNFRDQKIKKVFLLMIPRTFATAAYQINLIVITAIASILTAGSVSIFNFANNIQSLPIGIIGVPFAIATFPALAKAWTENKKEEFIKSFSSVFRQILFLIIPLSILIFILRNQIVEIILKHGQFTPASAQLTAACLGLFCFGIFAGSLLPVIFRAFFSLQDTKTPTLTTVASVALNIILSFYFTWLLGLSNVFQSFARNVFNLEGVENIQVLGLPLAFTMAGIFQFILAMSFLYKKIGDYKLKEIFRSFLRIFLASALMAVAVYLVLRLISPLFPFQTFSGVLWQAAAAFAIGIFTYLAATLLLKSPEIETIKSLILSRFGKNNEKHS